MCCFFQDLLDRSYKLENSAGSDILEKSPLKILAELRGQGGRHVDQCMLGATLEDQPIKKGTEFRSNSKMCADVLCDGLHKHLHLRGQGPGGSRTGQSAVYPDGVCDDILADFLEDPAEDGGSVNRHRGDQQSPQDPFSKLAFEVDRLRIIAQHKGYADIWKRLVDPWTAKHMAVQDCSLASSAVGTVGEKELESAGPEAFSTKRSTAGASQKATA
jgi:hypothetical protein